MLITPLYRGFKQENLLTHWNVLSSASLTFLSSDPSRMHKTDGAVCQAQEEMSTDWICWGSRFGAKHHGRSHHTMFLLCMLSFNLNQ